MFFTDSRLFDSVFKIKPGFEIVVFIDILEETTSGLVVVTKESFFIRFDELNEYFVLIGALTLAGFEVVLFANISIEVRSDSAVVMKEFTFKLLDEDTKDFVFVDDFMEATSGLPVATEASEFKLLVKNEKLVVSDLLNGNEWVKLPEETFPGFLQRNSFLLPHRTLKIIRTHFFRLQ